MSFHSVPFGVFLPVCLLSFWWLANRRGARSWLLVVASYVFYGTYTWWWLGLILASTLLDYSCGRRIHESRSVGRKRLFLGLSLAGNLGLLGFFKYYDWGVESLALAASRVGLELPLEPLGLIVPAGISFYTFQTLSYTIDIYRGVLAPARNLRDFALFVAFFPQLVAGPIVRAVEFLPQLERRPALDRERLHEGLYRIGRGLAKKVVIADVLGRYLVDPVYGEPGAYTAWMHLLAQYGFTLQIYYDFSGYSDVAIGVAHLFGFRLPENFHVPYQSRSLREFWRRWHISLSSWVRDYIYFPLGGSRGSEAFVVRNLLVTMVIIGLWHGASLLWVVYGLMQGTAMSLERWFERLRGGRSFATTPARSLLSWFLTFHFTVLSCMCIRAESRAKLAAMWSDFGDGGPPSAYGPWVLAAAALLHFLPLRTLEALGARLKAMPTWACGVALGAVVGVVAVVVVGETPYIYFQF